MKTGIIYMATSPSNKVYVGQTTYGLKTRKKMSEANIGKKLSAETKAKISKIKKDRVVSNETKRKMSGDRCYNAKLNWIVVAEIRKKYKSNKYSIRKLSKEYYISETAISDVVNNRTWKIIDSRVEL